MATFNEIWHELVGMVPKLSPLLAQKHVQRAWREIRDSRRWSFLVRDGVLFAPVAVSAGTVQVTQHSNQVTGNAAAAAVWDALANPAITDRQFRLSGGPIYRITAYSSPTLTLDRTYSEASNAAAQYQIYRCYFTPPETGFKAWLSVRDPVDGYRFRKRNLYWTRSDVDRRDPRRDMQSRPFVLASRGKPATGDALFEMWPHPIVERGYLASYWIRGTDLASGDSPSDPIPDALLMAAASRHAYLWAAANAKRHQELAGTDWLLLRREEELEYQTQLRAAQRQDEAIFLDSYSPDEEEPVFDGAIWLQDDIAVIR